MAWSEAVPMGSAFRRTEPLSKKGCWGTLQRRRRTSWRGTVAMSTPSMRMDPPCRSTSRKRVMTRDVLPLPVRPQMPILSPAAMERERSLRTRLSPLSDTMLAFSYILTGVRAGMKKRTHTTP